MTDTTHTQDLLNTAANFARLAAEATSAEERVKYYRLAAEWALKANQEADTEARYYNKWVNPARGW